MSTAEERTAVQTEKNSATEICDVNNIKNKKKLNRKTDYHFCRSRSSAGQLE